MRPMTCTSTEHPEGDLKQFITFARLYEYATELVELGFAPLAIIDGIEYGWEALCRKSEDY